MATEEKKAIKKNLVGGNMYGVLHNQYLSDALADAELRDKQLNLQKNISKLDYSKFF